MASMRRGVAPLPPPSFPPPNRVRGGKLLNFKLRRRQDAQQALLTLTLVVLLVALLLNGVRPSEATSAEVEDLQQLYAEFLTFKNDPEFHAVGYGQCCRYYEWMKKVEALRVRGGNMSDFSDFLSQFGILPGELIILGMEYYEGQGNGYTASMPAMPSLTR